METEDEIPQEIAGCTVLNLLGKGGMGTVYKARHRTLERLVAIKVLPRLFTQNGAYLERFLREARAAAKLQHPNLVQVYDAGLQDGQYYISMEYIEGTTLGKLLKHSGPLPETKVLTLLIQATRGLRAAHESGLIHRDIKPENLLLSSDGTLKIADFGLVSLTDEESGLTRSGAMLGTPLYMSPEQCDGQKVDARSDLYSLGATFHALLTGSAPYKSETPLGLLYKHKFEPVPDLRKIVPGISDRTALILNKLMAKRPDECFADASELLQFLEDDSERALARLVADLATRNAMPAAKTNKSTNAYRKNRPLRTAPLILTFFIVLTLAVGSYIIFNRTSETNSLSTIIAHSAQAADRLRDKHVQDTQLLENELLNETKSLQEISTLTTDQPISPEKYSAIELKLKDSAAAIEPNLQDETTPSVKLDSAVTTPETSTAIPDGTTIPAGLQETETIQEQPNLYRIPAPKGAVFSAEFPDLALTMRQLQAYLVSAQLGPIFDLYEQSAIRKKLAQAAEWYSRNVIIHATTLPWTGSLDTRQVAYLPDPIYARAYTDSASLMHRSLILLQAEDPHRAARSSNISAIMQFRLTDRIRSEIEDELLRQVQAVGLRFHLDKQALEMKAQIQALSGSELATSLNPPDRGIPIDRAVTAVSERAILIASVQPESLPINYLLRMLLMGVQTFDAKVESNEALNDQAAYARSQFKALRTLLKHCSRQVGIALDRDIHAEESIVLLSAPTDGLRNIFMNANGAPNSVSQIVERFGFDKTSCESVPRILHPSYSIDGITMRDERRRLQLLYFYSVELGLIAALGDKPETIVKEYIQRLQTRQVQPHRAMLTKSIPAGATAFVLLRPQRLNERFDGKEGHPLLLATSQSADSLKLLLNVPAEGLINLTQGMNAFADAGSRSQSWIAPELKRLTSFFSTEWHRRKTNEPQKPARQLGIVSDPISHDYDELLLDDALPVYFAITARSAQLRDEAEKFYLKASGRHANALKNPYDRILSEALLKLLRGQAAASNEVLTALFPQRVAMAQDDATPAWRETMTDLLISQARFLSGTSDWALPYARGGQAIFHETYGNPDPLRASRLDRLQSASLAWLTRTIYHPERRRSAMDLQIRHTAIQLLRHPEMKVVLWPQAGLLANRLERME